MLKSSKNDNKTKYSDITDKQIHHPKTALTPDSDKQKQKLSQAWRKIKNKTPKLQNSNKTKHSKTQTQQGL